MDKIEIIGLGVCPKCGSNTEIKSIISFPFAEEEQRRTVEACQKCNFEFEKDFSSSNDTTSLNHRAQKELEQKRTEQAIGKVQQLIEEYAEHPTQGSRPNRVAIEKILQTLLLSDFPLLYIMLKKVENSELGLVCFDPSLEYQNAARADLLAGTLTDGMADWYDNEVRACSEKTRDRVIGSIRKMIDDIEKNLQKNLKQ